jgi:hypothetical protein
VLRFSDGSNPGFTGNLRILGARILTTFYRRMVFMTYKLEGREIPVYSAQIVLEYRALEERDAISYLKLRPDQTQALYERRLGIGNQCYSAWHDGTLVDVCWSAAGSAYVDYLGRNLAFDEGDIYCFDSFTSPDYRGRGVYMARNSWQARINQSQGFKRSVALVAYENYAAWLILSRSGLKPAGTYHYIRLPGMGIRWQTL